VTNPRRQRLVESTTTARHLRGDARRQGGHASFCLVAPILRGRATFIPTWSTRLSPLGRRGDEQFGACPSRAQLGCLETWPPRKHTWGTRCRAWTMKPLLACPLATVVLARDFHHCSATNEPVLAHRFHESVPCDVFRVDFAKEIDTRRRFVASDVATCTDNVLGAAIGPDVSTCPDNAFGAASRSDRSNVVARPDIDPVLTASTIAFVDTTRDVP
jgi:hypothetical protein